LWEVRACFNQWEIKFDIRRIGNVLGSVVRYLIIPKKWRDTTNILRNRKVNENIDSMWDGWLRQEIAMTEDVERRDPRESESNTKYLCGILYIAEKRDRARRGIPNCNRGERNEIPLRFKKSKRWVESIHSWFVFELFQYIFNAKTTGKSAPIFPLHRTSKRQGGRRRFLHLRR